MHQREVRESCTGDMQPRCLPLCRAARFKSSEQRLFDRRDASSFSTPRAGAISSPQCQNPQPLPIHCFACSYRLQPVLRPALQRTQLMPPILLERKSWPRLCSPATAIGAGSLTLGSTMFPSFDEQTADQAPRMWLAQQPQHSGLRVHAQHRKGSFMHFHSRRTGFDVVDGLLGRACIGVRPAQVQPAVSLLGLLAGVVLRQRGIGTSHGGIAICTTSANGCQYSGESGPMSYGIVDTAAMPSIQQ
jgi:hypothetical protein